MKFVHCLSLYLVRFGKRLQALTVLLLKLWDQLFMLINSLCCLCADDVWEKMLK